MSRENPASHEENPEHHGKPEPREDAAPEEGAPKQPESQDNPAPREKSPVPGGNVESTGETAAEPAAESSAEGENEGSDSEERSEGQGERSEEHAQGKRSATFWIATACAVFVLVTAHLWAAGAFQESGPAPPSSADPDPHAFGVAPFFGFGGRRGELRSRIHGSHQSGRRGLLRGR